MTYFHTGIRTIIGAESFHGPVRRNHQLKCEAVSGDAGANPVTILTLFAFFVLLAHQGTCVTLPVHAIFIIHCTSEARGATQTISIAVPRVVNNDDRRVEGKAQVIIKQVHETTHVAIAVLVCIADVPGQSVNDDHAWRFTVGYSLRNVVGQLLHVVRLGKRDRIRPHVNRRRFQRYAVLLLPCCQASPEALLPFTGNVEDRTRFDFVTVPVCTGRNTTRPINCNEAFAAARCAEQYAGRSLFHNTVNQPINSVSGSH